MPGRLVAPLLLAVALVVPSFPASAVAQGVGVVEGTVTLRLQPPRRTAGRYPGAAGGTQSLQPIPAVVYAEGRVGPAPRPPARPPVVAQLDTAFVPAVVDAQGRFRIEGVPEGTYSFTVYHPDLPPAKREVRVNAGSTARLDVELR